MTITQYLGDSITHLLAMRWRGADFAPGSDWLLIWTAKESACRNSRPSN